MLDFVVIAGATVIAYLVGFSRGVRACRRTAEEDAAQRRMLADPRVQKALGDIVACDSEFREPAR